MLPTPIDSAIFYEDDKLYACLANFPIAKGHCIVVWKEKIEDLHLLKREDYEHLMIVVDDVRDALLSVLEIEKVYLLYMDEAKQVHWHLVPRYNEKGFDVFTHNPKKLTDVSLAEKLRAKLEHL